MLRLISLLLFSFMSLQLFAQDSKTSVELNDQLSSEANATLTLLVAKLPSTKLPKMRSLADSIIATKAPQVRLLLSTLVAGDLYYVRSNKQVVIAVKSDGKYQLTDVLTAQELDKVSKSAIRKIKTNNSLRKQINLALAQLDLTNSDSIIRLAAVKKLLNTPNPKAVATLNELISHEQDKDVRAAMQTVSLVNKLLNGQESEKLAAIDQLKSSLEPTVNNALVNELAKLPKDEPSERPSELRTALVNAIDHIDQQRTVYKGVENIFFGLSLGSVLLLSAIGLAITFGVMGVINMAHGEMMMLGAYTTYVIQQTFPNLIEYSLLMAIPAAFLVSGFVGVLIERGVIRFLKGRPLETLLATFGISLILQQLVRSIFSPLNRQVSAPQWMSGSLEINPILSLTYNRLYIIIFSLMVFFALLMILKKSALGLHVRAVSQNRDMARALSIKSSWVDAITFGLGSGIAGVAGVVLSQLTNVGPNLGQAYIIDSFLVVVFGGVGNLWGTLVAAMTLGTFNKFLEPSMGPVLANIIVLVSLVLFIQKRPKGLFPQKGRAAE
jgi:urea transport system permease protein